MKQSMKIAGGIALGALALAAGLYVSALRVPGEPLLKKCWAADLIDRATGEKIVGAEDMDFDPVTGTIFISAYDRRAVAHEIAAGKVTVQGGIYALNVADLTNAAALPVSDLTHDLKRGQPFLPHGFALQRKENGAGLYVINRVYAPQTKEKLHLVAFIEALDWNGSSLLRAHSLYSTDLCHPNDLAPYAEGFLITNDRAACGVGAALWEALTETNTGFIMAFGGSAFSKAVEGLAFPNGIALAADGEEWIAALTRGKSLARFRKDGSNWRLAE
ncbi:MAG TPA: hypothetical protein VD713_01670, partial [Sphingomonadales bacterium]|nr:hypothetical protein [Sphingomonadales bacterium]